MCVCVCFFFVCTGCFNRQEEEHVNDKKKGGKRGGMQSCPSPVVFLLFNAATAKGRLDMGSSSSSRTMGLVFMQEGPANTTQIVRLPLPCHTTVSLACCGLRAALCKARSCSLVAVLGGRRRGKGGGQERADCVPILSCKERGLYTSSL